MAAACSSTSGGGWSLLAPVGEREGLGCCCCIGEREGLPPGSGDSATVSRSRSASTRLSSERERVRGGVKSGQWPLR